MQKTIYAKYRSPEMADGAFMEFLQRGANLLDLVVITRSTFQDPDCKTDDGRLAVSERQELGHEPFRPDVFIPQIPPEEEILNYRDPFEVTEDGICLLDRLKYPGDLVSCLQDLGFDTHSAQDAEASVLDGGAVLILRVPSGPVDEVQGWETIQRNGGTAMMPSGANPYLG